MSLTVYNKKRDFRQTSEPRGKKSRRGKALRFVVQRHQASRLHYDFRLELNGALKSWAVPKGPSLNPKDKRLAVKVEDHPVSYISFEGEIPKGNYGAGTVEIWDEGTWYPINKDGKEIAASTATRNLSGGELKCMLKGGKLNGEFVLVRLKSEAGDNWLLIKHRDEYAVNEQYDSEQERGNPTSKKKNNPARFSEYSYSAGEKLSRYLKPMLTTSVKEAFDDKDWIFELKLDGYRAIADLRNKDKLFYSRNGISFRNRFATLFGELEKISDKVILDGEIVLLNEDNHPDFQKLQHYESNRHLPLVFYAFDLMHLNGKDITDIPLIQRKELLKELLGQNNVIRYTDHIEERGLAFFGKTGEMGLEGIIAKRKDSIYTYGLRSREWLKIKHRNTMEAVIAGYTEPKGSRLHFGSLILALPENGGWRHIGNAGTGFNDATLKEIMSRIKPLIQDESPFEEKISVLGEPRWCHPEIIAEVGFSMITRDGKLRHPVFIAVREDKSVEDLLNDDNAMKQKTPVKKKNSRKSHTEKNREITIGRRKLQLTNTDKIYWPELKIAKGDMIDYYEKVASFILPYLKDRPLSLKRNPDGIKDSGFYHKDAGDQAPDWMKKIDIHSESGNKIINYVACNDKASLIFLANWGNIEFNPWNSSEKKLDHPQWLVIDIDPSDKNTFDQVIETALAVKKVLDKAGILGYCKTSGASGLHVYIPMGNKYTYEQVKDFAHLIAMMTNEMVPEFTSLVRSLKKRGQKIYIDYLQNRRGQTLASAYSLRPVKDATISTPLEWKEVKKGLSPKQFTMETIFQRLKKKGDLFKPVLGKGIDLEKALERLGG